MAMLKGHGPLTYSEEPQNHRMGKVGSYHSGSPGSTSLLKQGHSRTPIYYTCLHPAQYSPPALDMPSQPEAQDCSNNRILREVKRIQIEVNLWRKTHLCEKKKNRPGLS